MSYDFTVPASESHIKILHQVRMSHKMRALYIKPNERIIS